MRQIKKYFLVFVFYIPIEIFAQRINPDTNDWLAFGLGIDRFLKNENNWLSTGINLNFKLTENFFMQAAYDGSPISNFILRSNYKFNSIAFSLGKSKQKHISKFAAFIGLSGIWGREETKNNTINNFYAIGLQGNVQYILLDGVVRGLGVSLLVNINLHSPMIGIKLVSYLSDNVASTRQIP